MWAWLWLGCREDVAIHAAPGFDPLYSELSIEVVGLRREREVALTVEDAAGTVRELTGSTDGDGRFVASWDGRDGAGEWTAPGPHRIRMESAGKEAEAELVVVRVGFVEARLDDDGGVSATRELLYWPVEQELQTVDEPIASLDDIDDGDEPLDFAEPRAALRDSSRPRRAEPAAYVYDSRPLLALTVGEEGALGSSGLEQDAAIVELSVPGWTVLSGSPLRPGTEVLLQLDEPLGDTVGLSALELPLTFEVAGVPIGEQLLPLRIYRLLDVSQFDDPDELYRPWAEVLDGLLGAIDGTPPSPEPVIDAVTAYVYSDLGLQYDTATGASRYTDYRFASWSAPHLYLTDFLQRRFGSTINCSDAANLLITHANMAGARLEHLILDPGFDLNFILAIGGSQFTSCPFGPEQCGFSYHAVTTRGDGELIWDATLSLDGDDEPGAAPHLEKPVHHVSADEYMERLVRAGDPRYHSPSQPTLQ